MRAFLALAALLALAGCDPEATGVVATPGASAVPSAGPGLTFESLALEVEGAARAVSRTGVRKVGSPLTIYQIGGVDALPPGAYGLSISTNGPGEAAFTTGNFSLTLLLGTTTGQPISYVPGKVTLRRASAQDGKGTLAYQGEMTCQLCDNPSINVDLKLTGLVLR